MANDFLVLVIFPQNILVYSLRNEQTGEQIIYNAGTLKRLDNLSIDGFKTVEGKATPNFSVNPHAVIYSDDTYETIYSPPGYNIVFSSNGRPVQHKNRKITGVSTFSIPDLSNSNVGSEMLKALQLENADNDSIMNYVKLSQTKIEQHTDKTYDELKASKKQMINLPSSLVDLPPLQSVLKPVELPQLQSVLKPVELPPLQSVPKPVELPPLQSVPKPVELPLQSVLKPVELPPLQSVASPEPVFLEEEKIEYAPLAGVPNIKIVSNELSEQELSELKDKYNKLKDDFDRLYDIVKTMNQRLYRIYPVKIPPNIRTGDTPVEIIDIKKMEEMINGNELERFTFDPMLQSYAGSHRGDVRMLVYHGKDGKKYILRAMYDPKTNKVSEVK